MDRLPSLFRQHLEGVVVRIEEFADREVLDSLGIDDRWNLTGLYHGRSLDEQSVWESGELPPVITLYRQPLLREWSFWGDIRIILRTLRVIIHKNAY